MRALIVDDSRPIRRIESNILQELGFETIEACDGVEALAVLESGADVPDVALVDWNMPNMNGLDLIKAVRADETYKPMIIVTATTETETSQMLRALTAGADEYLMKPFQKEGLIEKLRLVGAVS